MYFLLLILLLTPYSFLPCQYHLVLYFHFPHSLTCFSFFSLFFRFCSKLTVRSLPTLAEYLSGSRTGLFSRAAVSLLIRSWTAVCLGSCHLEIWTLLFFVCEVLFSSHLSLQVTYFFVGHIYSTELPRALLNKKKKNSTNLNLTLRVCSFPSEDGQMAVVINFTVVHSGSHWWLIFELCYVCSVSWKAHLSKYLQAVEDVSLARKFLWHAI